MVDCIEKTGQALSLNNQGIVKYLCDIEEERRNLDTIIQKQYQERRQVEAEIEKLTYKLCLINKSLSMRIKAKNNYDKAIEDIKEHYERLVDSSNKLRQIVEKSQQELDDIMNKKTGTNPGLEREEVEMLYQNNGGPGDCPCSYVAQIPTREKSRTMSSKPPGSQQSHDDNTLRSSLGPSESPSGVSNAGSVKPLRNTRVAASSFSEEAREKNYSRTENPPISKPAHISSNGPTASISEMLLAADDRGSTGNLKTLNTTREETDIDTSSKSQNINKNDKAFGYQGSDASKNLLLSRLTAGDNPVNAQARLSTTVSGRRTGTEEQIILDHRTSEDQRNKFSTRGLDEVLRAGSPRSSSRL